MVNQNYTAKLLDLEDVNITKVNLSAMEKLFAGYIHE